MKDIKLTCFDLKDIVDVLSDVLSELFPGFTLSYNETKDLLYKAPLEVLDDTYVFNCILNLEHDDCSYCIIEQKAITICYESYFKARKDFLKSVFAAGWPEAYSSEEMQLKIAAAGKEAFVQPCRSYISNVSCSSVSK
jgi:hypothetical protein